MKRCCPGCGEIYSEHEYVDKTPYGCTAEYYDWQSRSPAYCAVTQRTYGG